MNDNLFRPEMLGARRTEWLGAIRLATPVSRHLLTLCVVLLVATCMVLLSFCQYTRTESASGFLVPAAGLIQLKSDTSGRVTTVMVVQGQAINADDALIAISTERTSATLGRTAEAVTNQLQLQRTRVDADLADLIAMESIKRHEFERKIATLTSQLGAVGEELLIAQRQAAGQHLITEKMKPLIASGYVSGLQAQQQENASLNADAQVITLARQRLDIVQLLSEQRAELKALPLAIAAQRNESQRRRGELDQLLAQNEVQRSNVLHAASGGIVSSILVKEGQSIEQGQDLLTIVPKDSLLIAQLLVPSRAIGFIARKSRVILQYQAFPYQKFGLQRGYVSSISSSALSSLQLSNLLGQAVQEPMYRIEVELDTQYMNTYGTSVPLKPGMVVNAKIQIDKRSLLEWIFEPLYGTARLIAERRA